MSLELSPTAVAQPRGLSEVACWRIEAVLLPVVAIIGGFAVFAVFLAILGHSPAEFASLVWRGGFGTPFSLANTLQRSAPLLLTALCVALPAQLGLVVIGGEGAFVLGGLAAAAIGAQFSGLPAVMAIALMALSGALVGGLWIGFAGWLRHARGVNETISSLLLAYIAVALFNHVVEGPLRDPASLNKPSTLPLPPEFRVGKLPGLDVHWGFVVGVAACVIATFVIRRTTFGFAARIAGGNARAAAVQGLPVGRLVITFAAAGGAAAGIAGMMDVAAVHGSANAAVIAGYGYTGILVAFLARQNPLAIIPMAILVGGIAAASGLVQRRMGLPDATMLVLQGCLFLSILLSETLAGRLIPKVLRAEGAAR